MDRVRQMITHGAIRDQGIPMTAANGNTPAAVATPSEAANPVMTSLGTIPTEQPNRVGQGFAGVPGVGQLEIRYDVQKGTYSAHGQNNAQYALSGATTREEAMEAARRMIRGGGVSKENLIPLP
jgi:hypothetical protein